MSKYGEEINRYLRKLQQGDRAAVGNVFAITANHLRMVALRYLANKADYDDVVSDVFCKVMQHIDTFDATQDGYNWLCKITKNAALAYNEERAREKTVGIEEAAHIGVTDDREVEKVHLAVAMAALPFEEREILYVYFFEDMTYEAMAKKYDVVKSAVCKRIAKAIGHLKKIMDGKTSDE